jgi:hypothetical protein
MRKRVAGVVCQDHARVPGLELLDRAHLGQAFRDHALRGGVELGGRRCPRERGAEATVALASKLAVATAIALYSPAPRGIRHSSRVFGFR